MNTSAQAWLLAYDISDRKRLARILRFVRRHAKPLQHSLFFARWTPRQRDAILSALEQLIDPRHDDIRLYPLKNRPWSICLGRQHPIPDTLELIQPPIPPQPTPHFPETPMQAIE